MVKTRISVFPEIGETIDFFEEVPDYDADVCAQEVQIYHRDVVGRAPGGTAFAGDFGGLQQRRSVPGAFRVCRAKRGYKINQAVAGPLAASGKQTTPAGATEILAVIGREETVKRIRSAIEKNQ